MIVRRVNYYRLFCAHLEYLENICLWTKYLNWNERLACSLTLKWTWAYSHRERTYKICIVLAALFKNGATMTLIILKSSWFLQCQTPLELRPLSLSHCQSSEIFGFCVLNYKCITVKRLHCSFKSRPQCHSVGMTSVGSVWLRCFCFSPFLSQLKTWHESHYKVHSV